MNLPSELLAILGDFLLQSTILLSLGLLLTLVFRKAPAAWQHGILLASALGIPLLLLFSSVLPWWQLPQTQSLQPQQAIQSTAVSQIEIGNPITSPFDEALPDQSATRETPKEQDHQPQEKTTFPLSSFFALVALFGTLLLWFRLYRGLLSLSDLEKKSSPPCEVLTTIVAHESQSLSLPSPPQILLLSPESMPMTFRLSQHALALPSSASTWPHEKLSRIVRHELAHIKRNDCHTSWLTKASLSLLWFHPLAWWTLRKLDHTRETACDDLALSGSPSPQAHQAYAEDLLDIVSTHSRQNRFTPALAMATPYSNICKRMKNILNEQQDRRALSIKTTLLSLPIWLLIVAGLATFSACRSQEANAKISPLPTSKNLVRIEFEMVEFDKPDLIRKLFKTGEADMQYTAIITNEEREQILSQIRSSKHSVKELPTIVTSSGKEALFELVRDFIYPTEYDPPELPKTDPDEEIPSNFPVTPSSPKNFETRKIGLTYTALATYLNPETIDLKVDLDHNRFLGFINYGSPITAPAKDFWGRTTNVTITENRIEMPVFQAERFRTQLTVPNGQTIALIGFAPDSDKNLQTNKVLANRSDQPVLDPAKHTLYLIRPQYAEAP